MVAVRKTTTLKTENPNDPNVRDPEHAHELGGSLGMTVGGIAGGIAAGAAAGAAIGGVAGPVGAVLGAAVGGALGGSAGEEIAREVNPTVEEQYWEDNYATRDYVVAEADFETYRPAYRYGVDAYRSNPAKNFDDLEPSLRNNWGAARGESDLEWQEAREAARDAFTRLSSKPRK
jgi:predicted lipid-binding transport protein (Tim44 family)